MLLQASAYTPSIGIDFCPWPLSFEASLISLINMHRKDSAYIVNHHLVYGHSFYLLNLSNLFIMYSAYDMVC